MITLKSHIRSAFLKRRFLLDPKRKSEASLAACHFLIDQLELSHLPVVSFASKPFELNLWPLNAWLKKQGRLLLPKVERKGLSIYKVRSYQDLKLSSFGIQEPDSSSCEKISPEETSLIVLVPALCFDENFHRIGYGKGHYDQFLLTLSEAEIWGIGFKEQQLSAIPVESHDFAMDEVFLF